MSRPPKFIDPIKLRKHVLYDPLTGQFSLIVPTKRLPFGHVFSAPYPNNYIHLLIDGEGVNAGRAAWVYMTGEQPDVIDHWNGAKHDNRWENLRNGTRSNNMSNARRHRIRRGEPGPLD